MRSFQDDRVLAHSRRWIGDHLRGGNSDDADHHWRSIEDEVDSLYETEEEKLALVLNAIGPVVAIGNPGERLPYLGAARMYVGDEWQQVIADLVERARLIVLRAGWTAGLWWELQHVIDNAPPEKILLLIPFDEQEYEAFSQWVRPLFPQPLPPYQGCQRADSSLTGLVYFDSAWMPEFQELRGPALLDTSFRRDMMLCLEPVFAQLGIPYRRPRTYRRLTTFVLIVVVILQVLFLIAFLLVVIQGLFPGVFSF